MRSEPVGSTDIDILTGFLKKKLQSTMQIFPFKYVPNRYEEGTAINDFMNPDQIVIGTRSHQASAVIKVFYTSSLEP